MTPRLDRAAPPAARRRRGRGRRVPDGLRKAFDVGFPQPHPQWRFVFVNHALTNPFFVPAKNGSDDAAALLGTSVRVDRARRAATSARWSRRCGRRSRRGPTASPCRSSTRDAFNGPTALALKRGIPVVSYNADGGKANARLAYYGQDNYQSGLELGRAPRQPRRQRRRLPLHRDAAAAEHPAADRRRARRHPRLRPPGHGARRRERRRRRSRGDEDRGDLQGEPRLRGLFAVDAGSTAASRP